jgi:hypothetical protein
MFTVLDDMNECDYFDIISFSNVVEYWTPLGDKTEEVGKYDQNPMLEQCQSLRQPCFYLPFVKLLSLALI